MSDQPYEYYVDIVTKRYFHGIDNGDMELVMGCFHPHASLREMSSNTLHDGYDAIREMFVGLFAAHSRIWHGNFVHTADTLECAICSQFSVEVTSIKTHQLVRYESCNRFYLEDGKFRSIFVYLSGENLLK